MEKLSRRGAAMKILILHIMCILCLQCAHAYAQSRGSRLISLEQLHWISSSHERDSSFRSVASKAMYKSDIHLAPSNERRKMAVHSSDSGVEVEALMAFKQALNDTSRLTLSSWNATSLSPCKWKGITCSQESGRVVAIELAGLGLEGTISPLVGRLQGLQKLDLSQNFLTGKIPGSLVNCTHLAHLVLSYNTISGPIPPQIGQLLKLEVLNLAYNYYLDGPIPESVGNCSSLRDVNLTVTIVTGAIPQTLGELSRLEVLDLGSTLNNGLVPASLGNCSSLTELKLGNAYIGYYQDGPTPPNQFSLSNSQLTGTLPPELGNLKHLTLLYIIGTKLEGHFPPWMANCTAMRWIRFNQNQFTGTIPEYLGRLPLRMLYLYYNLVVGEIPPVIGNCTNLQSLYFSHLSLQGVIPQELGLLRNLVSLGFEEVNLEGEIPTTLSNCSALEYLVIARNPDMDIQALQPWIGSLRNLWLLDLGGIQLSGRIPAALGQLPQLEVLGLDSNQFSGSIEKSIGNCSELQKLYLGSNMLRGEIPTEIWALQNMGIFAIENNNLTGILTDGIANMSNLERITCWNNSFGGALPSRFTELSNLYLMELGGNNFDGDLPAAFGNMSAIEEVSMELNRLAGSIPASMGNLSNIYYLELSYNGLTGHLPPDLMRCTQLSNVILQNNALDGNIPVEIGQLLFLQELRLHNNNLSGKLPWTLGLCGSLQLLDVSYNRISGDLPGDIFINASFTLYSINLSHNAFSGAIPGNFKAQSVIAEIQLSANNFSGSISSSLGQLQSLQSLDVSANSLNGTIPKALGNLQNLTLFNASYNQLEGPLPDKGVFASSNFSAEWFLGNPELCGSRLPKHCPVLVAASNSPCSGLLCHTGILAAIISCSSIFGLLISGAGIYLARWKWRAHATSKSLEVENRILMFAAEVHLSGEDLNRVLDDPTKLISRGANSSVYRVDLERGPIAIKIVSTAAGGGAGDFPEEDVEKRVEKAISQMQREARTLAEIRHRNILKVLGMFSTSKVTGLMLEFMPLGSVHNLLHNVKPSSLSWETRLDIALGVAQGLVHLHEEVETPIIHRDLKPQNILLDADMTPKLGDFGISIFSKVGEPEEAVTASQWCGTVGYIPPEYARDTRVSTRGDVYTFGIVLLELLTARLPTAEATEQDGGLENGDRSESSKGDKPDSNGNSPLVDWVQKRCSAQSLSPAAVVDQSLLGPDGQLAEKEEQQMKMVIHVGLLCTQNNPQSRPRMHDVLAMLTYIKRLGADPANVPSINELAQEEGYAAPPE